MQASRPDSAGAIFELVHERHTGAAPSAVGKLPRRTYGVRSFDHGPDRRDADTASDEQVARSGLKREVIARKTDTDAVTGPQCTMNVA
jgi:hypothetical protein